MYVYDSLRVVGKIKIYVEVSCKSLCTWYKPLLEKLNKLVNKKMLADLKILKSNKMFFNHIYARGRYWRQMVKHVFKGKIGRKGCIWMGDGRLLWNMHIPLSYEFNRR